MLKHSLCWFVCLRGRYANKGTEMVKFCLKRHQKASVRVQKSPDPSDLEASRYSLIKCLSKSPNMLLAPHLCNHCNILIKELRGIILSHRNRFQNIGF